MRSKIIVSTLATVILSLGVSSAMASFVPTVIYSEVPGHSTAQVPGLSPGVEFDSFDRPYVSSDGNWWIISASSNLPTAEDEVIIVGSGTSGTVTVREGTPALWITGENVGLIDRNMGINNSGQYTFATNTDGPTTDDEYIVRWGGAAFEAVAQEGKPLPGLPTENFGSTLNSPHITNGGTVGFRATATVGALPSTDDDFLFHGAAALAQSNVTVPGNQAGGATEAWGTFDSEDYYHDATGSHYIIQGDLNGATSGDDVVVVDGNVVIQEDSFISGLGSPVNTILEIEMSSNGDWFARGGNDDLIDWVVGNTGLLAKTGDEITPGAGEHFSDAIYGSTFFLQTGNGLGDYIIAGTTDAVDPDFDAVLVLNGTKVVARQGDPVDIDGNGLFDDDAFLDIFNNDDSFLTDDLRYYFTADLRNGLGDSLGQAFIVMQVPEPGSLALLGLAGLLLLRRRRHR